MDRYKLEEQLGDGSYGCVVKGRNKETGKVVAIKRMKRKYNDWTECVTLREIESLRTLSSHPHIVQINEVIRESDSALYFVFEFMPDGNLYDLIKQCTPRRNLSKFSCSPNERSTSKPAQTLSHARIRSIMSQVLSGLEHMHSRGYFHRDIKPENLLLSGDVCKVADFGLAREIRSLPPYTDYVSTRWYRAPEVLLRSPRYGTPIDAFAVGCVMAELISLRPLFPGVSELDQISRLVTVLGSPDERTWPEGVRLAQRMGLHFPDVVEEGSAAAREVRRREARRRGGGNEPLQSIVVRTPLEKCVGPRATKAAMRLIRDLLKWDPKARPNPTESLRYPYFSDGGESSRRQKSSPRGEERRMWRPEGATMTAAMAAEKAAVPSGGVKRKSPDGDDVSPPAKRPEVEAEMRKEDPFGGSQFDGNFAAGPALLKHEQVPHGGAAAPSAHAGNSFGMPQFLQPTNDVAGAAASHSLAQPLAASAACSAAAANNFGVPQFGTISAPIGPSHFDPTSMIPGAKTPGLMPEAAAASLAALAAPDSMAQNVGRQHQDQTFGGVEQSASKYGHEGGTDEQRSNGRHHYDAASGFSGTGRIQGRPIHHPSLQHLGSSDTFGDLTLNHPGHPHNLAPPDYYSFEHAPRAQPASHHHHRSAHLPFGTYSGDTKPFQTSNHGHLSGRGRGPFGRAGRRAMMQASRSAGLPLNSIIGAEARVAPAVEHEPSMSGGGGAPQYKPVGSPMSLYVGGGGLASSSSIPPNQYSSSTGLSSSPGRHRNHHRAFGTGAIATGGRGSGGILGILNQYKSPKGQASSGGTGAHATSHSVGSSSRRGAPSSGFGSSFNFP